MSSPPCPGSLLSAPAPRTSEKPAAAVGMAFAGVHDSFWTHAADVPQLNTILRDKFVELYTQPLLENLAAQFEEQGHKVPPVPPKGDLDIEVVKESPYFFS